jgi:hypothetical protein
MNISIAISAARHGATIANHVRVKELIKVCIFGLFLLYKIEIAISFVYKSCVTFFCVFGKIWLLDTSLFRGLFPVC